MIRSRCLISALLFAALLAAGATSVLAESGGVSDLCGAFGTADFTQYWTGAQLLLEGHNPYSAPHLYALQQELECGFPEVSMPWVPPWVFVILLPFLVFSYDIAFVLWVGFSVLVFLWLGIQLTSSSKANTEVRVWSGVAALLFPPVLAVFSSGQISALLALGAVAFVSSPTSTRRRSHLFLAFCLFSLKPHLFSLVGVYGAWRLLFRRDSEWVVLAAGALIFVLSLSMLVSPDVLVWWGQVLVEGTSGAATTQLSQWQGSTLSMGFRQLLEFLFHQRLTWEVSTAVLLAGWVGGLWWFHRRGEAEDDVDFLAALLAVSILISPYGWFFDQVVCLPLYFLFIGEILQTSSSRIRPRIGAGCILGQLLLFVLLDAFGLVREGFVLYPLLLLTLARRRMSKNH